MRKLSWLGFLLLVTGCGSSTSVGSGNDAGVAPAQTGPSVTSGTCHFVLNADGKKTTFDGRARARMNGSGNLTVSCDGGTGDATTLKLDYGNATFDGPRTYRGDDFSSDARADYSVGTDSATYSSDAKGAGCTLVLTQAGPLDSRGDSVVTGGQVVSTFTCVGIVAGDKKATPTSYSVEEGALSAVVE